MNAHPSVRWVLWELSPQGFELRCSVCGATARAGDPRGADAFAHAHAEHQSPARGYYGAGDAVAAATKALGMQTCTPCEARRQAMNNLLPKVWRRG